MLTIYTINKEERKDRQQHIVREFNAKNEFSLTIIHPIAHHQPNVSLWLTIQQIVRKQLNNADDFFLLCKDDHQFTKNYDVAFLQNCIAEAKQLDADILLGGVSWQKTSVQVSDNLFWMEQFTGLQFTIIFKKFYQGILSAEFENKDAADHKIAELTDKKFVIHPAISTQKEFGYSDVTPGNNAITKEYQYWDPQNEVNGAMAADKFRSDVLSIAVCSGYTGASTGSNNTAPFPVGGNSGY